ncbi:unnamed protein product [Acanthoscelides obtectus]|uniref:C-type lectin domain-containing protein n=2 Tax=Acanthoscelides obtectus TaxID=200917 RepID=A0A9P0PGQ1_ACAOB|nr:unnamed protein product [Acanthoscelides obtectus]CAK1659405.1 hypothetical protein AOBTE_LOCUS21441 [Acanthoscelides obtectus]
MCKINLYILAIALTVSHGEDIPQSEIELECGNRTIHGPKLPLVKNGDTLYYYGFLLQASTSMAQAYCHRLNMKLLSIETKEEEDFLRKSVLIHLDGDTDFIIRTSGKRLIGHRWTWEETGKQIQYTNWGESEPNNLGGHEDCLVLLNKRNGVNPKWHWNDDNCHTPYYFICEYSLAEIQPRTSEDDIVWPQARVAK